MPAIPSMTRFPVRPILGGLKSFLPLRTSVKTGGTASARYAYGVWLRHLRVLADVGVRPPTGLVVEFGPGDTLACSIAALLTGASAVVAADVVRFASVENDLHVLDELLALFGARAPLPADAEFPDVRPRVASHDFPTDLLPEALLAETLAPARVARIRQALAQRDTSAADLVTYLCPWPDAGRPDRPAELIFSQAVLQDMEHGPGTDVLRAAFAAMHDWLAPGGHMSHQINFASPFGRTWNDHWAVPAPVWRIIRGARPYYNNRLALSEFLALATAHDFEIRAVRPETLPQFLGPGEVAGRFRALPATDFSTPSAHVVLRRRP